MKDEKTSTSEYYDNYQDAVVEIVNDFDNDEIVTMGFNCKKDDDGELLFQCVISNVSDLMDEAVRWSEGELSVILDDFDKISVFHPDELFEQYPQYIDSSNDVSHI